MVQGIFMYWGDYIIFSKSILKGLLLYQNPPLQFRLSGVWHHQWRERHAESHYRFCCFTLYVDFYFCLKACILLISYNIWYYVEAESLERGMAYSQDLPQAFYLYEQNQWAPATLSTCVVFCVDWARCHSFGTLLLSFSISQSSFVGQPRPCCL